MYVCNVHLMFSVMGGGRRRGEKEEGGEEEEGRSNRLPV